MFVKNRSDNFHSSVPGKQVLTGSTVQNMLSLMYSCGMYDYSGEWSFEFGLPAKSGVSGSLSLHSIYPLLNFSYVQ